MNLSEISVIPLKLGYLLIPLKTFSVPWYMKKTLRIKGTSYYCYLALSL